MIEFNLLRPMRPEPDPDPPLYDKPSMLPRPVAAALVVAVFLLALVLLWLVLP